MSRIDLGEGAWLDHDAAFVGASEADRLLAALVGELAWEQREIVLFGRRIMQPRLIAWAGGNWGSFINLSVYVGFPASSV